MSKRELLAGFLSIAVAAMALPASATDVTQQRLMNAAGEPQNWLMTHRDYDNLRHSALKEINRDNVRNLALKYTFSIGGRATGGVMRGKEESTPLVDDGFMYVSDTWSRVMKFDVRSGSEAIPLWRYDPKITRARTSRGLAMYANKVFVATYDARIIALDRDSGEVIWETQAAAPTVELLGPTVLDHAPLPLVTLERRARDREARDRHQLAPGRLPAVLALAIPPARRPPEGHR